MAKGTTTTSKDDENTCIPWNICTTIGSHKYTLDTHVKPPSPKYKNKIIYCNMYTSNTASVYHNFYTLLLLLLLLYALF